MFNILSVVSAVEAAFTAAEDVEAEFAVLKPYVTQFMQTAENTYANDQAAGASKLKSVLDSVEAVAQVLGVNWSAGLEATITAFINLTKAAFNAFAAVITAAAPSTSTAVTSATDAVSNVAGQVTTALGSTVAPAA